MSSVAFPVCFRKNMKIARLLDISFQKTRRWMSSLRRSRELQKKYRKRIDGSEFQQEKIHVVSCHAFLDQTTFTPEDFHRKNLSQTGFTPHNSDTRTRLHETIFSLVFLRCAAPRDHEESGGPWNSAKMQRTSEFLLVAKPTRPSKQTKTAPKNKVPAWLITPGNLHFV